MPPRYFKDETLIETRCDHCGALHKETLARLYSPAVLMCSRCGQEHTADRRQFRQTVDETEALVDSVSRWAAWIAVHIRNLWNGMQLK